MDLSILNLIRTLVFLLCAVPLCLAERVAILISEDDNTFLKIADNAESALKQQNPGLETRVYKMWEKDESLLRKEFLDFYPKVSFTIGRPAAVWCQNFQTFSFVYAMVLDPYTTGLLDTQDKNTGLCTGILTRIDPEIQLMRLRAEIKGCYKLGTLHTRKMSAQIGQESELARKLGFELHALPWKGTFEDFGLQFKTLIKKDNIDTFWFREAHLSKDIFDYLVEFCQLYHLNLLTFNPNHLEQGATLAVSIDYEKLGFQAATLITQILRGVPAEKIPVQNARQARSLFLEKNLYSRERT